MDQEILQQLIGELVSISNVLLVIDSGGAVGELRAQATMQPEFKDGWATIEVEAWHVHLDMKAVQGVQFVEAEDHGHDIPKLYYVRLSDAQDNTLMRFYFPNPWLNQEEKPSPFQPQKLELFEGLRDRYVGRGGIVFVQMARQGSEGRGSGEALNS